MTDNMRRHNRSNHIFSLFLWNVIAVPALLLFCYGCRFHRDSQTHSCLMSDEQALISQVESTFPLQKSDRPFSTIVEGLHDAAPCIKKCYFLAKINRLSPDEKWGTPSDSLYVLVEELVINKEYDLLPDLEWAVHDRDRYRLVWKSVNNATAVDFRWKAILHDWFERNSGSLTPYDLCAFSSLSETWPLLVKTALDAKQESTVRMECITALVQSAPDRVLEPLVILERDRTRYSPIGGPLGGKIFGEDVTDLLMSRKSKR
jgi:hypothetical protein